MNRPKDNKLNSLLSQRPNGLVISAAWLRAHGYYKQLVKHYCDHGWLLRIGQGAYTKVGDSVTWEGALKTLQEELQIPIHVGGLTALELAGYGHYVAMAVKQTQLFLTQGTSVSAIPEWFFSAYQTDVRFSVFQKQLFSERLGVRQTLLSSISLDCSVPERAILELLSLVPQKVSYEHAYYLSQGLQLLRPDLMQLLLEDCRSVKVKRLFLHLAEHHQLACLNHFDIAKFHLGSGNRVIGVGGIFDAKYQLSVPKINDAEE